MGKGRRHQSSSHWTDNQAKALVQSITPFYNFILLSDSVGGHGWINFHHAGIWINHNLFIPSASEGHQEHLKLVMTKITVAHERTSFFSLHNRSYYLRSAYTSSTVLKSPSRFTLLPSQWKGFCSCFTPNNWFCQMFWSSQSLGT